MVDIAELDELDKQKALLQLMTKLAEAKVSVSINSTVFNQDMLDHRVTNIEEFFDVIDW